MLRATSPINHPSVNLKFCGTVDNYQVWKKKDVCHSPLMLIAEEPNIHLIPISLHDLGWPVAKSFHAGPYQLMSGSLFNTGGSNLFRDTHTNRQTDKTGTGRLFQPAGQTTVLLPILTQG